MKSKELFIQEWNSCQKIKIFEILLDEFFVYPPENGPHYAILNIYIDAQTNEFCADNIRIPIDYDMSVDENLEALYETVLEDITEGPEFYL